ncbi:MAG: hypothetical protein MUO54_06960 [Anaerolineales bacterium]|nr:hypothetical protein [Anaerolineales bacterium]
MSDFQGQIESERGKLKELLLKIPGFKGYIELEDRRTADKFLRDVIADRYQELVDRLSEIQVDFVDRGDLVYVDDLEAVVVKLRTFIDRIRHAAYGYSSFFSVIKIDSEKLDKIYDYDFALLSGVDSMADALVNLESIEDPEELKGFISDLKKQAQEIVTKADQRKEVITSEGEKIEGGEVVDSEFVEDDEIPSA